MEYISPNLHQNSRLRLNAYVQSDSYSILCHAEAGGILGYVHEEQFPRLDQLKDVEHQALKTVRLATPFTLIPASEYKPEMKVKIAQEAFSYEKIDHVYDFIVGHIACVYIVSSELKSRLIKDFSDYHVQHTMEFFLAHPPESDPAIFAHWTKSGIILMAYREGLRLANYYSIAAPEDAVYYILSAYKHVGLDPLSHSLDMSGRIANDSIMFDKISGFVRSFKWKNENTTLAQDFSFEPHLFYHLM